MRGIALNEPWHGSWQRDQVLRIIVEVVIKAYSLSSRFWIFYCPLATMIEYEDDITTRILGIMDFEDIIYEDWNYLSS